MTQKPEQEAAVMPIDDDAEGRENMIFTNPEAAILGAEVDDEAEDVLTAPPPKTSKKRIAAAFALFAAFVGLFGVGLAWFFGMGSFAAAKKQTVDRTAKTSAAAPAPVTEDEKLRMALNMVAEKAASQPTPIPAVSKSISPDEKPPEMPSLALPGETIPAAKPSPTPMQTFSSGGSGGGSGYRSQPTQSAPSRSAVTSSTVKKETAERPLVRSLYFGDETPSPEVETKPETTEPEPENEPTEPKLPFGVFLPVRTLGAIYALPNSGSLVRLELTQAVAGDGYELAAGTVLVGRVRGSELGRVMVEVAGLIDPASGGLVAFEGEVVGTDGASGIAGRRRSVRSNWSKLWSGLREAGATALGALGGRRSGTVVIADRASGSVSGELAEMVRNDRKGEYVEIAAGTSAYVLVTELPRSFQQVSNRPEETQR